MIPPRPRTVGGVSRLPACIAALVAVAVLPILAGADAAHAAGVSFRSAAVGTGSRLTVDRPAGVVAGDVLVAGIAKHEAVATAIRPPTGWRLVLAQAYNGSDVQLSVYVKAAGSAEPTSYTWETGDPASNAAVIAYAGVDPGDPVVAAAAQGADNNETAIRLPSLQVPVPNTTLVMFALVEGPTPNPITPPNGFTERAERAVHPTIEAADAPFAGTGATGSRVATSAEPGTNVAALLSLRPSSESGVTVTPPPAPAPDPAPTASYRLVASDGGVFAFGDALFLGSTGGLRLARPVIGTAATPSGAGYWLVASDGGVFAFGDAVFRGSTGALRLASPIVGMAATPSGRGYWLVASDGGVFAFGDAVFRGSTGGLRLASPIVGMAATPSGVGYWLVASDGGVFAFGDAVFRGSTGAIRLARPIVGARRTPSGAGYWLVASDGGVFAFGDAVFRGSTGALRLASPIVGVAA